MVDSIERGHDPRGVEKILRALPSWFGIEESLLQYVADAAALPSYLAREGSVTVGVALINRHYPESAELHLIAVDPNRHRTGIGSALIAAVKADLAADGVRMLQVHTVGPSWEDAGYERTRQFYRRQDFVPIQEFDQLDWHGPTQVLVTPLGVEPFRGRPDQDPLEFCRWQFDMAWGLLDRQLETLTDAACRWPEPERGWWTVRATDDGSFAADWVEPEPEPAPPVTVGWLTWQITWWWRSAMAGLRDEPLPPIAEVRWPGSAQATIQALRKLHQEWRALVGTVDLSRTAVFPWRDQPGRTAAHVVWWVNTELMKNAAEIGQLLRIRAVHDDRH